MTDVPLKEEFLRYFTHSAGAWGLRVGRKRKCFGFFRSRVVGGERYYQLKSDMNVMTGIGYKEIVARLV